MKKLTLEQFIQKAKEKHGDKYDYNKSIYVGMHIKLIVICPTHGEFLITPDNHIRGKQCFDCGYKINSRKRTKSIEYFINKSNEIHNNKYTYINFIYINTHVKSWITCPKHGDFEQSPANHLSNHGCPNCFTSKGENLVIKFLNENKISFESQFKFEKCINPESKRKLPFDFYIPKYNICIEYDGLQHFRPSDIKGKIKSISKQNIIFKDVQSKDKIKNNFCKENNILLIRVPYYIITMNQLKTFINPFFK